MIICLCQCVSETDITRVVDDGCSSFTALQAQLGVATRCGRCRDDAEQVFVNLRRRHDGACAGCSDHGTTCTALGPALVA